MINSIHSATKYSKIKKHYSQFIKYCFFGIICFIVDIGIAEFLLKKFNFHPQISSIIGYFCCTILFYVFSIYFIFEKRSLKDKWKLELSLFILIELIVLTLLQIFLHVFMNKLNLIFIYSKISANILAAIFNYCLKHFILFSNKKFIF